MNHEPTSADLASLPRTLGSTTLTNDLYPMAGV